MIGQNLTVEVDWEEKRAQMTFGVLSVDVYVGNKREIIMYRHLAS